MPDFEGPYGPISLPDSEPPIQAAGDYGDLGFLMNWAAALQSEFQRLEDRPLPAYLKFIAYGVLNEEYDGASGLGVILYCDDADQESGVLGSVPVGDVLFPIAVRRVRSDTLTAPPGLNGATPTCWASSNRPGVGEGFLTAKHVLGPSPEAGLRVPLTGGGHAKLIDRAPECIDAVLLSHAIDTTNPIKTNWSVALTQAVEVDGNTSGISPARVTAVADPLGSWATMRPLSALSLKFLVSFTGQLGDSGALVHADPRYGPSDGLGIYLGTFSYPDQNFSEGYCQHLEQIRQLMNLDLYLL